MTSLRIRKRGESGEWWHIWPEPSELAEGVIQEDEEYEFELLDVESPDRTTLEIDGIPLQALRSPSNRSARWLWSPGFYSGLVRIEIKVGRRRVAHTEIQIDPNIAKLTRDRYHQMIEDILEDSIALFSIGPYRTGIPRGSQHELPPIARLEYLHSRMNRILEVVNQIDKRPVRILKSREQNVKYHEARNVTGKELVQSMRSGAVLQETRDPGSLPESLDGVYPATIRKKSVETGLDIQEHREIKSVLDSWRDWLLTVSNRLDANVDDSELGLRRGEWASRSRGMATRLGDLLDLQLFESVADIPGHPTISSIYRQKPNYLEFFQIYQEIQQGLTSVAGDSLEIPISKTYDLYEFWCFLRIARIFAEDPSFETPDISSLFDDYGQVGLVLASGSVTLELGDGYKLCYQENLGEYWNQKDRTGSISRPMRPDITLIKNDEDGPSEILVFDAKYRVETGLNDSLSSVHTYRDAIVREQETGDLTKMVSGGFLLSPHSPELQADWKDTPLPDRLFDPGYRSEFLIGAAHLSPGMSLGEIRAVFRRLCDEAEISLFPSA